MEENRIAHIYEGLNYERIQPSFRYQDGQDFKAWQEKSYQRLWELLGLSHMNLCEPELKIEGEREIDGGHLISFSYQSEPGYYVPGYILLPHGWKGETLPGCICLQGHSSGMHNSLAIDQTPEEIERAKGMDRDFAVRAVKEGYVAICIEQRFMGKTGTYKGRTGCSGLHSMAGLLVGRTAIGARVWDTMRLIDVLEQSFDYIDTSNLICMGNSGGGTATFYIACIEKRIRYAMPSCAFCTYKDSIVDIRHCACNYIPNIAFDFDMGDLAGLIAPRRLIVVNGDQDPIFPKDGVEKAYAMAEKLLKLGGGKSKLVTGNGPHRFFADLGWAAVHEMEQEDGIR